MFYSCGLGNVVFKECGVVNTNSIKIAKLNANSQGEKEGT
jgi:hypothetical protein